MKWVIFISFLSLVSFAELKNLPRRYRHIENHDRTIKLATQIPTEEFAGIVLSLFSQSVQKATLEEVKHLKDHVVELHKKCAADEHSDPKCAEALHTVYLDQLCHDEDFAKKYEFHDCCAKADSERNECLLAHKNSSVGFIPAYVRPTAEDACKNYQSDKNIVLAQYLYEVSRRNPKALTVVLFHTTQAFDKVLATCCEAADKNACFNEKAREVKRKFMEIIDEMENTCFNLNKYGKDTLYRLKLIEVIKRFPNANKKLVEHIAKDIVHVHEETCKGDTLESLLDRVELSQYVCTNKDALSSKLDHCCEAPLLERTQCLANVEHDKPADLPKDFIKEEEVCQSYAEHGDEHFENFLFNFTRSHSEVPKLINLEIVERYEELVKKCCKLEEHVQCLHTGDEQLKLFANKIVEVVKNNCDQYKKMGNYFFQNEYIIKYSKIIPQMPSSYIIELTKRLVRVAEKCCGLDSDHQVSCAVEDTDRAIGYICRYHKEHHLNKQICHCCDSSFITRWECVSNLGADPEHVPSPFKPKLLDNPEDLCLQDEHIMHARRQSLLIDLQKSKPNITEEQLASATVAFHGLLTQCCEGENKKECFTTEGKKVIDDINAF